MDANSSFLFDHAAFYGRSLEEYERMFNLNLKELKGKRILDCCAGPASFAYQAAQEGIEVVACDPSYHLGTYSLSLKIKENLDAIISKHAGNPQLFHHPSNFDEARKESMEIFIKDFKEGKKKGRYVPGELPHLPFAYHSFDLVLCANFLFIYSDKESGGLMSHAKYNLNFHYQAISELLRVARERVCIYPLQGPEVKEHAYLSFIIDKLMQEGLQVELIPVKQRDLIGAEQMLQISI